VWAYPPEDIVLHLSRDPPADARYPEVHLTGTCQYKCGTRLRTFQYKLMDAKVSGSTPRGRRHWRCQYKLMDTKGDVSVQMRDTTQDASVLMRDTTKDVLVQIPDTTQDASVHLKGHDPGRFSTNTGHDP
jgi:hypothetical protein